MDSLTPNPSLPRPRPDNVDLAISHKTRLRLCCIIQSFLVLDVLLESKIPALLAGEWLEIRDWRSTTSKAID